MHVRRRSLKKNIGGANSNDRLNQKSYGQNHTAFTCYDNSDKKSYNFMKYGKKKKRISSTRCPPPLLRPSPLYRYDLLPRYPAPVARRSYPWPATGGPLLPHAHVVTWPAIRPRPLQSAAPLLFLPAAAAVAPRSRPLEAPAGGGSGPS